MRQKNLLHKTVKSHKVELDCIMCFCGSCYPSLLTNVTAKSALPINEECSS
jgi:hypothetical protein